MSDLLDWYDHRRRDLPWRLARDPYRIWISEIMLQQTQVKKVIPYYEAFIQRFPTLESLAEAPVDEVLALWSGLGYYRRARFLHRAAVEIVETGEGFPTSASELQKLPGIGPYTAAAVASIAFGEVIPVLDGNVERLLCRWLGCEDDPKKAATRRRLTATAMSMLDPGRPGDSNQALMELGATVCRPRGPICGLCPIEEGCRGRRSGDPERFPKPRRRRRTERVELSVAVCFRREKVLLFRRSEDDDLLPGMWELPNVPRSASRDAVEKSLAKRYGGLWQLSGPEVEVRHAITYRSITLFVRRAVFESREIVAEGPEATWADAGARQHLATSSMVDKAIAGLKDLEC